MIDRFLELGVVSLGALFWGISDLDVGLKLGIFEVATLAIQGGGLGDPEDAALIDEAFPPDGSAGAGDRHADELSDAKVLVGIWEEVGV